MILVFGSLNVDLVLSTPEHPKPGETVLCTSSVLAAGGKGCNQAVAAARAGATVAMTGRVGGDALGDSLMQSLQRNGVDSRFVLRSEGQMTGCATVSVDSKGENIIYVAPGANRAARAMDISDEFLRTANLLICQMEVLPGENWKILERAKKAGVKTVLNCAPAPSVTEEVRNAIKNWVDYLVVNYDEGLRLYSHNLSVLPPDVDALVQLLATELDTCAIVTAGPRGAFASDGISVWNASSLEVNVVDTTGAGDTFTGVFAAMIEEGLTVESAMRSAAVAASLACRKLGAQEPMPSRNEIEMHVRLSYSVPG